MFKTLMGKLKTSISNVSIMNQFHYINPSTPLHFPINQTSSLSNSQDHIANTVTLPYLAMKNLFFSMLVLLSVLFFLANVSEAAVQCNFVVSKAAPCAAYATGKAPEPSNECCSGLKQLAQSVKSVDDKKDICRCLKSAAKSMKVNDAFLSKLPDICKINVGFRVSSKTNCETIH